MAFELLTQINESVRDQKEYETLVEEVILEFFGDEAASTPEECEALWAAAKDAVRDGAELTEAGMDRHAEREWMQQAAADSEKRNVERRTLGMKGDAAPQSGQMVVMQNGIGKIVAVEPVDKMVIIRNKAGEEKVFPYADLLGPKNVNGKMAWALQGATSGTRA